jgi:aminoglycoside phosphotransferase family enzyme
MSTTTNNMELDFNLVFDETFDDNTLQIFGDVDTFLKEEKKNAQSSPTLQEKQNKQAFLNTRKAARKFLEKHNHPLHEDIKEKYDDFFYENHKWYLLHNGK